MNHVSNELIQAARQCARATPFVLMSIRSATQAQCDAACGYAVQRAAKAYAARLRALNISLEHGIIVVRDLLRIAVPTLRHDSVLTRSTSLWLLDGYYRADQAVGD